MQNPHPDTQKAGFIWSYNIVYQLFIKIFLNFKNLLIKSQKKSNFPFLILYFVFWNFNFMLLNNLEMINHSMFFPKTKQKKPAN